MEKDKNNPIDNKSDENKKNNAFFYSIILIIAVLVILGLILLGIKIFGPKDISDIKEEIIKKGETKDGYMYNGFIFIERDNLWHTEWQRGDFLYSLHFHYSPAHVDQIPVIGNLNEDLDTTKFYITFDPLEENTSLIAIASLELNLNLVKGLGTKTIPSCTKNETKYKDRKNACADRPIITCNNTKDAVIFIKTAEDTKVILDDNCITVQGKGMDLLKAVDKVLFDFYGIIKKE